MRNHDELREFAQLFAPRGGRSCFEPNTDVLVDERDRAVIVQLELAGADADSLKVTVDGDYLTIAGARAQRDVARDASLLRKEIQYGEFQTIIRLPVAVLADGAVAQYRDGILSIRLPLAQSQEMPIVRTTIRMTVRRTPA
ncbi:hypothetical protein WPS_31720 [Vulcanimicrobium alpinum]|uniref:SHSP domain-containing protein n=1 Tax=Vulcanimicrobium alpinum TaxID=3016050 RepID=A0AAN1XZU9_UNVUL|nr:Hsp20/alpha crystallin family protein [Vulcanimicrobium alpinum]BDE07896.1 hypothetical protein WPS_31720 [Vulcanimicrobium alpinum]